MDPRLTPARQDLAAEYLRGEFKAERYVSGKKYQIIESAAPLRKQPRPDARLDTQALFGEIMTVYDEHEGWVWGQLESDDYVGYLPHNALSAQISKPTHRVTVLRTFIYPEPDIKSPPLDLLSMGSQLSVTSEVEKFIQLNTGGFIYSSHVAPVGEYESDYVEVAEKFAGTPYLWGGKTSLGLDCSGLVHLSLSACGKSVPRDSDMMQGYLGEKLPHEPDLSGLERGDLVFWQGHIAIMCDNKTIIHTNGYHMNTVIEPLEVARDRISNLYGEITEIKRMPEYLL